jgi:hypothetical protein
MARNLSHARGSDPEEKAWAGRPGGHSPADPELAPMDSEAASTLAAAPPRPHTTSSLLRHVCVPKQGYAADL